MSSSRDDRHVWRPPGTPSLVTTLRSAVDQGSGTSTTAPLDRRALARIVDSAIELGFLWVALVVAGRLWNEVDGTGAVIVGAMAGLVGSGIYEVVSVGVWGFTLGKRAFGLKVVRNVGDRRLGLCHGFSRVVVPACSLVFFPCIRSSTWPPSSCRTGAGPTTFSPGAVLSSRVTSGAPLRSASAGSRRRDLSCF
ncbi:MAG: RDD family protein [Acidimicrobiia bacterium]